MDKNKDDIVSFFNEGNKSHQHVAISLDSAERKTADELVIANKELVFQNEEKEKRASELVIANKELAYQNGEKEKRASELLIANKELLYQNEEKEKRASELVIADLELAFQNEEKEKRALELIIANKELLFQNEEKKKRASELVIAAIELAFQNGEKEKRASELVIANKELLFQNEEKEKRASELVIAAIELAFQMEEKERRASELIVANKELAYQNEEKEKRALELIIANIELAYQNEEKEKRASELVIANKELAYQNEEKEERASELVIANKELVFQNKEKEKRASELVIANKELAYQNEEKEKRASELVIANKELVFQNKEKEKRASELIIANQELVFQNKEKEKRAAELSIANRELVVNAIEKSRLKVEKDVGQKEVDEEKKQLTARLQLATSGAGIGIWDWDVKKDLLIWDEGMYMLYNIDSFQFGSVYEGWISRIHPGDKHRVNDDIQMALAGERKYDTEFRLILDDASIRTIKATGVIELDNAGKPNRMIGANWDISSQRSTEEKLIKTNRLYTFISQINQSIVRAKDEKTLFRAVCDIALEFGMFKMAWVGLFDKLNKVINLVDQSGIPAGDIQYFNDVALKTGGPQQRVFKSSKYFVSNDIANDSRLEDWKVMLARYGVNSCIILPVKKSGNVVGTFNLYSGKLNSYDTEEIALLLEVTGDISFALDTFEKEKKHKAAEELVLQNEKLFRALIEKNQDMITLGNRDGELIYGSPSITAVLGYSAEELINMSLYAIVHPDDIPELMKSRDKLLTNPGKSFNFQHRRRHKNGNWIWCEGTFTNMLDEPGINAVVTNFRDVSQKKIADEQKEFDLNNLDALINNTDDLMWSVDRGFNIITSNQPFNAVIKLISGKTAAEGVNILEAAFSTEESKRYKRFYERAFAGENFTEIISNEALADTWSEISYYPIRTGNEVIGVACHSRDITESIKTERQIILNEKRFRALVENSADAVVILSPDGSPSYVSPSIQAVLGYTEEEAMALNLFSIVHPDDSAIAADVWARVLESSGLPIPDVICRIRHKNGTWRWLEGTFTNLLDDPSVNGIVDNFRDVTDKKLAEEELLLTDFAIDNAGDAVFWMTADARIVKVNEAACAMLGYAREEMISLSVPDIDPYYDAEKWFVHYENLRREGTLFFETIQRAKDGRLIPVEIRANYVKFGDAEFNYAFSRDITERKLAETKLVGSEIKLKEAQTIARMGNFEINMADFSEKWSDQLYEILGVENNGIDAAGSFSKYIHPDDLAVATEAFYNRVDASMDCRIIREDGVLRYIYGEWKFEIDNSGNAVRVYGILQDITERKQGEMDRKNLVNDLLLRNSELEQFAYVASHDLQEPLRMITSFMTQLAKKYSAVLDDKGRKYIHFAVDGAKRMRQIILDLLEFSRVGKTGDDLEEVDINKLINEILALYRRQMEELEAQVIFEKLPAIKTYKTPLRQVFQNLIGNSLKYHKAGTAPVISIGCTETKTHFQFSVSDNGIGIAPEYAQKIFIIFQRLHNKDEYSGTGMGLAIVKKIVESLGGKIWVESAEGRGATFYFTMMKTPNQ